MFDIEYNQLNKTLQSIFDKKYIINNNKDKENSSK